MTHRSNRNGKRLTRWIRVGMLLLWLVPAGAEAQVRMNPGSSSSLPSFSGMSRGTSSRGSAANATGNPNNPFGTDSTAAQSDTSATKGLVYHKEIPDSVLRQKVFLFHHRTARVWIDEVWNPTLDPTGVQFSDPLDALNGNYYLGKGSLGHPHTALFPTLADGLRLRLQPDIYPGYAYTVDNINFFQTLTPFSTLTYGGSLADDHSLRITHTQNIMPGWNASFDYRLFNPEGVYTSSGALNNYLNATTNYFSADSRLQASAALIWQAYTIDENGGLSNDSIFILRQQSNRAGIPVVLSNAGTLQRNLSAMASVLYSLERQSDTYRERDSLAIVQVDDSTTRVDTIVVVDTIPLRKPHVANLGVVGAEVGYDRQKRVFADSTHWREQQATLYWTNDAYVDHRWRNPLKVTVGLQPRYLRAVIGADTLRSYSWLNPFLHAEAALWRATLALDAEQRSNPWAADGNDRRLAVRIDMPFDSAGHTRMRLDAQMQDRPTDLVSVYYLTNSTGEATVPSSTIERYSLQFKHKDIVDLSASASHIGRHLWIDTALAVHQGQQPFWLFQGALTLRLRAGAFHLDMQHLLQHSTDSDQLPVPLWATKNSLYADFPLFQRTLRAQVGVDLRYHTPYHAPLYDPATGLFLQQDALTVGGYLWGDVFVNIQVKRASIYVKAGHVNALWETPATYLLLPHYPGQGFGLQWGLAWAFFD